MLPAFSMPNSFAKPIDLAKESPITLCLAYFFGLQERKIELSKQMGVFGAVSPSSPGIAGLENTKPWEYEALKAVKDTYAQRGLQWKVLEGTPSLEKVKLGLPGRDEEIDNFITLMKNMNKIGLDIFCYNWMP